MTSKTLTAVIGLLLVWPAALTHANTNIVVNPGFEEGTTNGWQPRGNCTIIAVTGGRTGTYRAFVTTRSNAWNGIRQSVLGKIDNGQTVTLSGWVRLPAGVSDQTMRLSVEQQDGSGTRYFNIDSNTGRNSQWTQLSGQFTLNAVGTVTVLDIYFETATGTDNFYLDDAAVMVADQSGGIGVLAQVDVNTRHQTIEGFGAAGAWYDGWLVAHPRRNELYNVLFGDLGLDIYRLRNTYDQGSDGAATMSNAAQIVNGGQAALGRPLKIMISSWSPPTALKSNNSLNQGTLKRSGGNYIYAEFGQWWADSVQAWAVSYGITADYISIQNEPDWIADWDTCRFDPVENATNAGYNAAFDAVYDALHARMGSAMPKMIAPETTGFHGAAGYNLHQYLNAINDHSRVYGYAHHLYNINAGDNPDAYLSAMSTFHNNWGHKPLFQTEYEKSTDHWPDALNMALLLHNSLVVEQVAAYIYWDLFWANGGLVTLDNPWQSNPGYTINSDYYGFKHFSAFIHHGWQRVDATADSPSLRLSAYLCPDNQNLSVVLINTHATAALEVDLSFLDAAISNGSVYRTTAAENCLNVGTFDGSDTVTLPPNAIVTISLTAALSDPDGLYGDFDGNNIIDIHDLQVFLQYWLTEDCGELDLNDDCVINLYEFSELARHWLND